MSKVSLLCRGKSLGSIKSLPQVNECVIVNSFQNELKIKDISEYVTQCKKVIHVCSLGAQFKPMISDEIYKNYNIQKIVLPYIEECCPPIPDFVRYIGVPIDKMLDINKEDMVSTPRYKFTSPTAGMDALLYCVNDLQKKEVNIIGMDFYDGVGYLTNSHGITKVNDGEAISRAAGGGDTTDVMKLFFMNFVKKHDDVNFNIFTKSKFDEKIDNLNVILV